VRLPGTFGHVLEFARYVVVLDSKLPIFVPCLNVKHPLVLLLPLDILPLHNIHEEFILIGSVGLKEFIEREVLDSPV
jgi:hypothetical protein